MIFTVKARMDCSFRLEVDEPELSQEEQEELLEEKVLDVMEQGINSIYDLEANEFDIFLLDENREIQVEVERGE